MAPLQFCKATRVLFCSQTKKTKITNYSTILLPELTSPAILEHDACAQFTQNVISVVYVQEKVRTSDLIKNILIFYSKDEWRSYGFGTRWWWVINLGWNNPLKVQSHLPLFDVFLWQNSVIWTGFHVIGIFAWGHKFIHADFATTSSKLSHAV